MPKEKKKQKTKDQTSVFDFGRRLPDVESRRRRQFRCWSMAPVRRPTPMPDLRLSLLLGPVQDSLSCVIMSSDLSFLAIWAKIQQKLKTAPCK